MTALSVAADTRGVDDRLAKFAEPLNMERAWRTLVELFVVREEALFERQPWRKLSPKYAAAKAKEYPGAGLLERTGALKAALTQPAVRELHPDHAVIGVRMGEGRSQLFYGQFHQEGKGVPKRTLLQRFTRAESDEWADVVRVDVIRQVLG